MQTIHVLVEGRVQGVCFRDYTCQKALSLKLKGWVRNLPNGSVEIVMSGTDEGLSLMLEWLSQGSPRSRVDNIKTRDASSRELFTTFDVRY